jgi:hypothetical protein
VTWSFDTATNKISLAITAGAVGSFDEAAQDAVFNAIADSATIDVTYNDASNSFSLATIANGILAQLLTVDGAGSGLDADTLDGLSSDAFALAATTVTAGGGLIGSGTLGAALTLAVGAGTGITVNADDVAVNQAFTPTWTGLHTFQNSITANHIDIGEADAMVLNGGTIAAQLQINSDTLAIAEIHTHSSAGATFAPILYGARGRGTEASPAIVANGDYLLRFVAVGYDGVDYAAGASIDFIVTGTPGSNDMPTDIVFSTTPDGTQVPVEALRIGSTKLVTFADGLTTGGVIDLGHASDTTIARVSAGVVSIEGSTIITAATYTAADVLAKLVTVDGTGSGLDADLLDGINSAGFLQVSTYQALTPTWTGAHTFGNGALFSLVGSSTPGLASLEIGNASPILELNETDQGADAKRWQIRSTGSSFFIRALNDAGTVARGVLEATRTGAALTNINFGNVTDNPAFAFLGTGSTTFSGATQHTTLEIGNASDTTLSRSAAGLLAVEGNIVPHVSYSPTWTGGHVFTKPVVVQGHTVATLPAGTTGMLAHVTDALAPVFGAAVVGGGTVMVPVYYTGAAWFVG